MGLFLNSKPSMTMKSFRTSTVSPVRLPPASMIAAPLPSAERSTIGIACVPSCAKAMVVDSA